MFKDDILNVLNYQQRLLFELHNNLVYNSGIQTSAVIESKVRKGTLPILNNPSMASWHCNSFTREQDVRLHVAGTNKSNSYTIYYQHRPTH